MFGDSECSCHCHFAEESSEFASEEYLCAQPCERCSHNHSHLDEFKSKSLDETHIEPPTDFMSPIIAPSAKESTSLSFPCSPHTLESPSAEQRPLQHFLSDGNNGWRDWESAETQPPPDIDLDSNPRYYGGSFKISSGYHSSGPYHYGTAVSSSKFT